MTELTGLTEFNEMFLQTAFGCICHEKRVRFVGNVFFDKQKARMLFIRLNKILMKCLTD